MIEKLKRMCVDNRLDKQKDWKEGILRVYKEYMRPGVFLKARVNYFSKKNGGYRSISLLHTFGKVLNRLINARPVNWYKKKGKV